MILHPVQIQYMLYYMSLHVITYPITSCLDPLHDPLHPAWFHYINYMIPDPLHPAQFHYINYMIPELITCSVKLPQPPQRTLLRPNIAINVRVVSSYFSAGFVFPDNIPA